MTPEQQLELFRKVEAIEASGQIDGLEWKGLNLWVLFRLELLNKVLRGLDVSTFQDTVHAKKLSWRQRLSMRRKERSLGKRLAAQLDQTQISSRLVLLSETDQHYKDWGNGRYNHHLDPYLEAAHTGGLEADKLHAFMKDATCQHAAHRLFEEQDTVNDYLWLGQKLAGPDAPDMAWTVGRELDVNVERVMGHAAHIRQWMELLTPWMEKQTFEAVGVLNYHNPFCMALIEAARIHNRPSFDIQHGKQGSLNFSYSSFAHRMDRTGSLLPDGHWNWNVDSAKNVQRGGYPFRCAVGGNGWLNKNRAEQFAGITEAESAWLERVKSAPQGVLFCAQPQQDYVLPDFLEAFAKDHPEVEIGVRFHPRQNPADVPGLERLEALPNVNMQEATSIFLYTALQEVGIVATRWSTVALEARLFGKRAWITDPFGVETFSRWVEEGHMTAALDQPGWEAALELPDPAPFPTDMAPSRTPQQYRDCFEFLMQPLNQRSLFDPQSTP